MVDHEHTPHSCRNARTFYENAAQLAELHENDQLEIITTLAGCIDVGGYMSLDELVTYHETYYYGEHDTEKPAGLRRNKPETRRSPRTLRPYTRYQLVRQRADVQLFQRKTATTGDPRDPRNRLHRRSCRRNDLAIHIWRDHWRTIEPPQTPHPIHHRAAGNTPPEPDRAQPRTKNNQTTEQDKPEMNNDNNPNRPHIRPAKSTCRNLYSCKPLRKHRPEPWRLTACQDQRKHHRGYRRIRRTDLHD
jgi:hypothetical protein